MTYWNITSIYVGSMFKFTYNTIVFYIYICLKYVYYLFNGTASDWKCNSINLSIQSLLKTTKYSRPQILVCGKQSDNNIQHEPVKKTENCSKNIWYEIGVNLFLHIGNRIKFSSMHIIIFSFIFIIFISFLFNV